jgi:putative ABC transport system substrate-binding protein
VTAVAGLIVARANVLAQVQGKVYRIGYPNLRAGPSELEEAFLRGMRDLGYVVGRNLFIEYRWGNNDLKRFDAMVDELVRLNVDVIVTSSTGAVLHAMQATRTIPIVMAVAADPVEAGLVASLVHPGGNVTGLSLLTSDLAGKRLQLLRELVPGVTRVGVLGWRPAGSIYPPGRHPTELLVAGTQAAGRQMGIEVSAQVVLDGNGFAQAFSEFKREGDQALIVQSSPLAFETRATILEMAARQQLPDMYEERRFVDAGGLVCYGANTTDLFRRAATQVDKILKGAKAGDLPVEQPTKFDFVVNLKTAKALGLTIPQSLLLRADEVIQ